MERVYSEGGYTEKERKPEECKEVNRRIRKKRNRSETIGENRKEKRSRQI